MTYRTSRRKKRTITDDELLKRERNFHLLEMNKKDTESKKIEELSYPFSFENDLDDFSYSITKEKLDKFFGAVKVGSSYTTACDYSEINRGLFYACIEKGKKDLKKNIDSAYVDFYQMLLKKEAEYEVELLTDISLLIKNRDPFINSMLKYLSVKYPNKWRF